MKKLFKIALVLVVLVLLIVGGGVYYVISNVNSLAKAGIERGGTFALGVPTTVRDVNVSIFAGGLTLGGLNVANPPGYPSPSFMGLKSGDISVSLSSLRQDVIEVPKFKLEGIDLNIERKGASANYKVILDNLSKLTSSSGSAPSSGGSHKKLVIKELELKDIKIHANLLGAEGPVGDVVGKATKMEVPIDQIKLTDVGKGGGVSVEQLTSLIVEAVFAAAIERGGGILPADILGDLKGGVAGLGGLSKVGSNLAGGAATGAGETAAKAVEDVGKKIGDGLGGLLPGTKKEEPKKK